MNLGPIHKIFAGFKCNKAFKMVIFVEKCKQTAVCLHFDVFYNHLGIHMTC